MFKEGSNQENDTIIGQSVRVEGDFITEGNIIIEGTVSGTIKTEKNLRVGPKAKIFANISADNAMIAGEIQGNIRVNNQLELTATAKIYGDVRANVLIIAPGSILNGRCQMGDGKSKTIKPDFAKQRKLDIGEIIDTKQPTA